MDAVYVKRYIGIEHVLGYVALRENQFPYSYIIDVARILFFSIYLFQIETDETL